MANGLAPEQSWPLLGTTPKQQRGPVARGLLVYPAVTVKQTSGLPRWLLTPGPVAPGRCAGVVCAGLGGKGMIHLLPAEHLLRPGAVLET